MPSMSPETAAWFASLRERRARSDRAIHKFAEEAKERVVAIPGKYGITLVVHRDTYPDRLGQWRVTRFEHWEGDPEPTGHAVAESYEQAVQEAVREWGGDLTRAEFVKNPFARNGRFGPARVIDVGKLLRATVRG